MAEILRDLRELRGLFFVAPAAGADFFTGSEIGFDYGHCGHHGALEEIASERGAPGRGAEESSAGADRHHHHSLPEN